MTENFKFHILKTLKLKIEYLEKCSMKNSNSKFFFDPF